MRVPNGPVSGKPLFDAGCDKSARSLAVSQPCRAPGRLSPACASYRPYPGASCILEDRGWKRELKFPQERFCERRRADYRGLSPRIRRERGDSSTAFRQVALQRRIALLFPAQTPDLPKVFDILGGFKKLLIRLEIHDDGIWFSIAKDQLGFDGNFSHGFSVPGSLDEIKVARVEALK